MPGLTRQLAPAIRGDGYVMKMKKNIALCKRKAGAIAPAFYLYLS